MTNLDNLDRLARAATPGPWRSVVTDNCEDIDESAAWTVLDSDGAWLAHVGPAPEDAAYIAALSPDVVLKLIAVARAAQAWADSDECDKFLPNKRCEQEIIDALDALTAEEKT